MWSKAKIAEDLVFGTDPNENYGKFEDDDDDEKKERQKRNIPIKLNVKPSLRKFIE